MADLQRIKDNASRLIDFLDACSNYSSSVPLEVYTAMSIPTPKDDGKQSLASILFWSSFELIGSTEFKGAGIISWFLGGLVNFYGQDDSTPPDLNKVFNTVIERYATTMIQMRKDLGEIWKDPSFHLDDTYKVPFGDKGYVSVSDLGRYDVPDRRDPDCTDMVEVFRRALRRTITSQVMPQKYKIACVYDRYIERPDPFEPEVQLCSVNPEDSDSGCSGNKANCPVEWHGDSVRISAPGSHNNNQSYNQDFPNQGSGDSLDSLRKTISSIIQQYGGGSFYSSGVVGGRANYYQYWLISCDCGDAYYCDDSASLGDCSGWQVAPKDFTDWLFSDDGCGKVVAADGVATRADVFTKFGLTGSKGVVLI